MSTPQEEWDNLSDEAKQKIRDDARIKLEEAVGEYHKILWQFNPDVIMVGGWVIIIHGVNTDVTVDNYLVERAAGQPWHSSMGLIQYGFEHFDSIRGNTVD